MSKESSCCAPSSDCCNEETAANQNKTSDDVRSHVRESYAKVAEANNNNESSGIVSSCCGVSDDLCAYVALAAFPRVQEPTEVQLGWILLDTV